ADASGAPGLRRTTLKVPPRDSRVARAPAPGPWPPPLAPGPRLLAPDSLAPLHVVRVDRVLIAQVQPAVRDDRVRPRRQRAARDLETPLLAIPLGRGLSEPDDAVLAEQIQVAVGMDERALADAAMLPQLGAVLEAQRRQDRARE